MKLIFESFQTYMDYERKGSKWGTPENLKEDAVLTMKHILPTGKDIDSIEDKSDPKKGIKFEVVVGKDTVHLFKVGRFRGEWEFYLNKKKISKYELSQHFLNVFYTPVEQFLMKEKGYEYFPQYFDGTDYKKAIEKNKRIVDFFDNLSSSDKKKALQELLKRNKSSEDKERIERTFKI